MSDDLTSDRPPIRLRVTVLDTPDPRALASFYAELLGWSVDPDENDDDWVEIRSADGERLAFQLAIAYRAPSWPNADIPQQLHLDLSADDLDAAQDRAESLGAVRRQSAEEGHSFRVMLDPTGHPFCLCRSGG